MKFRAWHLAFALLLPLWAQAQESSTAAVLAISGGRIIDGWGGTPIENGVVVIRGNKIEAVGPAASVALPAGARTIDYRCSDCGHGWSVTDEAKLWPLFTSPASALKL